ncbi:hypothetical protein ASJ81_10865 [Methanosarcina spelaei]|uniref:Uncharacterized protein n=1 Tax=Methanosarcina spelaei TaxID=1036679 RepID=A0A2A2HPI4_9EURY|nr:hypothetical protein [Methanosarcina spelaei]PAV11282.1 hypothetical protein ASJ81_10865 [Methanosarcina spelaei]
MSLKILNIALSIILVNILWNCALGSCSQNGDDTTNNITLTFGPETLIELKSQPNFIAAYGSIPSFATSEERMKWLDKLNNVYQETISEMFKYMYPNGPVTAYGYTIDGVLQVGVNKTIEKPFMDEIYKIFDLKASLIGIKEVPVVFVYQGLAMPVDKVTPVNKTTNMLIYGEKSAGELNGSTKDDSKAVNGNISSINNSSGNKSDKINSTPGLGLLGGLICLYGGWRLRKN